MKHKKVFKFFFFPHISVLIVLLLISAFALVYSFICLAETSPFRIASYVISFYTLVIWCIRTPKIVSYFRKVKSSKTFFTNIHFRVKVTLAANLIFSSAYAILQLVLAISNRSAWFFCLFVYHLSLALMRFFLVKHTLKYSPADNMKKELLQYRTCGIILLLTNTALSAMLFHMLNEVRVINYGEIVAIAMAAYTFTTFTVAIVGVVRFRKYNSPVYSAAKIISFISSCVSMLTLEQTMLCVFSDESMTAKAQRLLLTFSGAAISVTIVSLAIFMIIKSSRALKKI